MLVWVRSQPKGSVSSGPSFIVYYRVLTYTLRLHLRFRALHKSHAIMAVSPSSALILVD